MFSPSDDARSSADRIRAQIGDRRPSIGFILGSGLGTIAESLCGGASISFADLPGFPHPTVEGHAGRLVLGRLGECEAAIVQGRAHLYETGDAGAMRVPLETLKILGCRSVVMTNSAGSLRPEVGPGSLVLITDHINFAGTNPLIHVRGPERFVDMSAAYDEVLRARFHAAARRLSIPLHEGVYIWFAGPSFETPAEIRAARALGADVVGMSTVPETLLARWLGLRVAALSVIANPAAGMGAQPLSHATSIAEAEGAVDRVARLLTAFAEAGGPASPPGVTPRPAGSAAGEECRVRSPR